MNSASAQPAEVKSNTNQTLLSDYLELTKPGITLLVLFSMSVGFILGAGSGFSFMLFVNAAIGTFLIASGTAAHNQYIERDLDKKMIRTVKRPLPAKKISAGHACLFSITLIITGFFYLLIFVNPLTGLISALTTVLYLGFYTPLKRITFVNVMVGAVPGALPPVGGWAAATGSVSDPAAWVLFAIVFLWQVPHVVAIAWLCNDDYRSAGFKMLPESDKEGIISALTISGCLLMLIPASVYLFMLDLIGLVYLIGAILSGLFFLYFGLRFQLARTKDNARKVLYGSLVYLPAVWVFILFDLFISWLVW
ncbi:heme o synthase [Natronogracilivirga saccharolytica]|uniref:Protoheme IX farnesyltransferase n=1 Tax=Natronogracilivirga saccharolytica TaxID=2812953 RepID=A0A8J7S6B3_9BACT|nr:heme o synthase [Natronogracilivirga saccharolytica]MBP3191093.1 protoheme IX farnesyltransferase [Natronogracilivirga saccharolytica]